MLWFSLDKGHGYMRTEHDERPFVARSRPWIGTVGRHVAVVARAAAAPGLGSSQQAHSGCHRVVTPPLAARSRARSRVRVRIRRPRRRIRGFARSGRHSCGTKSCGAPPLSTLNIGSHGDSASAHFCDADG
jgi:hypothetical protein